MFLDFRECVGSEKGPLSFLGTSLNLVCFPAAKFNGWVGLGFRIRFSHWRKMAGRGRQIPTTGVRSRSGQIADFKGRPRVLGPKIKVE